MSRRAFEDQRARLLEFFKNAVSAVSAENAMPRQLPHAAHGRTRLIAVGKAAAAMTRIALDRIDGPVDGLVVTRYGHLEPAHRLPEAIEVIEAGHPVPDDESVRAAMRALAMAGELDAKDHLLVLLSGGGSALLAAPVSGISLADKQNITRSLLLSGATISEINCVRKHLSRVKGGRLAAAAGPAHVTTFIISDVPGDDPSFVSSGPTVPDMTTLEMAREIIRRYGIAPSPAVAAALNDPANETPPVDTLGLAGSETVVIARARDALASAAKLAAGMGYEVTNLGDHLQSEARYLGAGHAALARRLKSNDAPRAIISGGEATVAVANKGGRGGRNLEYLLGMAIALDGAPGIYALACDTDGLDGTEDNAGAYVLPDSLARARALGLDPQAYLERNDSYRFFEALGDLIITGPTLTNVNDFRVILTDGH
ncbi:MAG: glycerate kinase [Sphingomonadales bacterium]